MRPAMANHLGACWPLDTSDIIMAIVAVLGTGGFLTSLRALYLARPDREKTDAERERLMSEVRSTTIAQWHELADSRQEEIIALRERLAAVETCLDETRVQLRVAQAQVAVLETERIQWQQERMSLLKRIEELEGKK